MIIKSRTKIAQILLACSVTLFNSGCSSDEAAQEEAVESGQEAAAEGEESADADDGDTGDLASEGDLESGDTASDSAAEDAMPESDAGEMVADVPAGDAPAAESGDPSEKSLDQVLDETLTNSMASQPAADVPADTGAGQELAMPVDTGSSSAPSNPVASAPKTYSPDQGSGMSSGDLGANGTFTYIVQPGDTLGLISSRIFGDKSQWQAIAGLSNLANPNRIFPGDEIQVPNDNRSQQYFARVKEAPMKTVVVKQGDTLSKIAQEICGSPAGWVVIWKQNQDKIKNPNTIYVGQTFAFQEFAQSAMSH